jgi:hypothetical protein
VDTNDATTTAVDEQVLKLRGHLLASAAILRDRSRHILAAHHAKKLRLLARAIERATAGACILCGLPDRPSDERDLETIKAAPRNLLCMSCKRDRESHSARGRCVDGGRWSPISAHLLLIETPRTEARSGD